MRSLADLQRDPAAGPADAPPALPLDVARVRTFDTPEFAGMRFLEVAAKTALNRVRGMPFDWSINPYRGCSHACTYCMAADTPILMGDGRTKALAEVMPGDAIYGTERRGSDRRYVITRVLDRWCMTKPAYRVRLADGTALVASAEHRFLTERGWKHVSGAEVGRARHPHLTAADSLMGTGRFAVPPKADREYRLGYICGMVRGDAHLGTHRFRLALADPEGLDRTAAFLAAEGVQTRRFSAPASPDRRAMEAIGTSGRGRVERIRGLTGWPATPSDDWGAGLLAGMFDALGGCGRDTLRIFSTDRRLLRWIARCLDRFGFSFVIVEPSPARSCGHVRLLGGLRERLRFLHATDPAITRKRAMEGQVVTSAASNGVVAVESLGVDVPMVDLTTGTGDFIADGVISHNCFARPSHAYLNLSPLGDFERTIVVKTNVAEVLRRELARPGWRGEHVAMGTNTDPYQRCEGRYRLMPGIITALGDSLTPFSILTKGTLIARDLDTLVAAADRADVTCALTVGLLDEELWRAAEPGTPSPKARLGAVRALNEGGIPTGVMLAPIMPGLNDDREQLAALVDACAAAGATHITPIVLHLRPGVRELFMPWLEAHRPELVARYEALYRGANASRAYRQEIEAFVAARRRAAWRRHGGPPKEPRDAAQRSHDGAQAPRPPVRHDQLALW